MGYYIRLFATDPLDSLVLLHTQVQQKGLPTSPVGRNQLDIRFHAQRPPISADLTDSRMLTTRQQVLSFIEEVSRLRHEPDQHLVLNVLARTQALVTVGVPDGLTAEFAWALDCVLTGVSRLAEGLFQVDGAGFYDGPTLILRIE
jgi:hypothetical protein